MMYSLALATFHLSLADASLQDTADELLQDAIISFPDVLLPLLGNHWIRIVFSVSDFILVYIYEFDFINIFMV